MSMGKTGILIAVIGLLCMLSADQSAAERPPKPGPDYTWETHHTTPEGHYIPGRWVRTPTNSPCPRNVTPRLQVSRLPPPVPWVNPNMPPVTPAVPQYNYSYSPPVIPAESYVVPALIGASVLWSWNGLYSKPGGHVAYYPHKPYYPIHDGYHATPGKHYIHKDYVPAKHYGPLKQPLHPPVGGKYVKPGKGGAFPGKPPGKGATYLKGKTPGKGYKSDFMKK